MLKISILFAQTTSTLYLSQLEERNEPFLPKGKPHLKNNYQYLTLTTTRQAKIYYN